MSLALNGSSVIRHFKHSNAIEIRDGITFDLYNGIVTCVVHFYGHMFLLAHSQAPAQLSVACSTVKWERAWYISSRE